MSTNRVCQICYREENVRYNFGNDFEAENEFHMRTWCDCGYSSGEEMMLDQDLGFSDNRWVCIVKYFLNEYYLKIRQGAITNKDDANGELMLQNSKATRRTYSLRSMADFKCKVVENQFSGLLLNIDNNEVWSKLIGSFNAYNLLST